MGEDDEYYWDPEIFGDIESKFLPVNSDPTVIGSSTWNPNQTFMDNEISIGDGTNADDGSDWWNSITNAFGSALGNVGKNALNAASQNANAALAKKYGAVTTNLSGTKNVPPSQVSPAMLLTGAAILGVILYLSLRRAS